MNISRESTAVNLEPQMLYPNLGTLKVEEASEGTRRAMRQRGGLRKNTADKDGTKTNGPSSVASGSVEAGVDGGASGDTDAPRARDGTCSLSEATEAELLAELVRRRKAVRVGGGQPSSKVNSSIPGPGASTSAGTDRTSDEPREAPAANSHDGGDSGGGISMASGRKLSANQPISSSGGSGDTELDGDLAELQLFCTADGCERRPVVATN